MDAGRTRNQLKSRDHSIQLLVLQLRLILHLAQRLAHLDLVPSPRHEREALRCLKDHDDCASEHESAHLFARGQGLTMKQCRSLGVDGFGKGVGRVLGVSFIGSKVLEGHQRSLRP
jgi:hypothetical protein